MPEIFLETTSMIGWMVNDPTRRREQISLLDAISGFNLKLGIDQYDKQMTVYAEPQINIARFVGCDLNDPDVAISRTENELNGQERISTPRDSVTVFSPDCVVIKPRDRGWQRRLIICPDIG
jgi:hypothetical protein